MPLSVKPEEGDCEREGGGGRAVLSSQEHILRQVNFRKENMKVEGLDVNPLNTIQVHVPLKKSLVFIPQFADYRPTNLMCQACIWALGRHRKSQVPIVSRLAVWRGPTWEPSTHLPGFESSALGSELGCTLLW